MSYWPTTAALFTTAAKAAISQLSPPPPSAATILIILLIITVIISVIAIRCFLDSRERAAEESRRSLERKKYAAEVMSGVMAAVSSTVTYKAAGGEDAAAECPICKAELEEGEEMKVLGNCRHGLFHGGCIERWFLTSWDPSCPVCRQSCLPPTVSPLRFTFDMAICGGG